MAQYRCPVDDVIFESQKAPGRDGSPDCDGPSCREKFAAKEAAAEKEAVKE
jgi:hypothetical protein